MDNSSQSGSNYREYSYPLRGTAHSVIGAKAHERPLNPRHQSIGWMIGVDSGINESFNDPRLSTGEVFRSAMNPDRMLLENRGIPERVGGMGRPTLSTSSQLGPLPQPTMPSTASSTQPFRSQAMYNQQPSVSPSVNPLQRRNLTSPGTIPSPGTVVPPVQRQAGGPVSPAAQAARQAIAAAANQQGNVPSAVEIAKTIAAGRRGIADQRGIGKAVERYAANAHGMSQEERNLVDLGNKAKHIFDTTNQHLGPATQPITTPEAVSSPAAPAMQQPRPMTAPQAAMQAIAPSAPQPQGTNSQDISRIIAAENAANQQGIREAADSYVQGMQQRQQANSTIPQYLRFADTQNQRDVNSRLGIQMDYGNLPSSDTQLAFADRAENRAQRGDTLLRTVMNPVTYNGIRVNNQAIASNLSMGEGRRQELAQAGFEVSPEGVIRRSAPRQTGGGTFGFGSMPSVSQNMQQTPTGEPGTAADANAFATAGVPQTSVIDPENVIAGRARYGLAADGSSRMPAGRRGMIMANTDLTPEQKAGFIAKLDAYEAGIGRQNPNELTGQSRAIYEAEQAVRQGRMQRGQMREARYDAMRQAQAQAIAQQQQAQTTGMIAQQAMMGNEQALQILGNMQMSPADAARVALGQQQLAMEGMRNQQEMGLRENELNLRGREINQRGDLAMLQERNRASDAARQTMFQQQQQNFQNEMLKLQQQENIERAKSYAARSESEKALADANIGLIEQQKKELELKNSQFEKEKGLEQKGWMSPDEKTEAIKQEMANGSDSSTAVKRVNAYEATGTLASMAESGNETANKLYNQMRGPEPEIQQKGGASHVSNAMDRANTVLNFSPSIQGGFLWTGVGGRRMDGSNQEFDINALRIKFTSEGIDDVDLRDFVSNPDRDGRAVSAESPEGEATLDSQWRSGRIPDNVYEIYKKQNIVRSMLGMPPLMVTAIRDRG